MARYLLEAGFRVILLDLPGVSITSLALGFTLDYPGYFEGDGIGGIKVEGVYALCPLSQLGLAY
jgi:hypothetical protein